MIKDRSQMEVEYNLLLVFWSNIHQTVSDSFIYLSKVFDLLVFLEFFSLVDEDFKVYGWIVMVGCHDEFYQTGDRLIV